MSIIEIEKSLNELHQELQKLLPATKLAEKAVESVEIAKSIPEKHKKLIDELKSVFIDPNELEKEDFVNVYSKINRLLIELNQVKNSMDQLTIDLKEIVKQLEDIPQSFDGIIKRLHEISGKISEVYDQIHRLEDKLIPFIKNSENGFQNIEKQLDIQNKKILEVKSSVLMAIIISGLSLIALVIIYFIK